MHAESVIAMNRATLVAIADPSSEAAESLSGETGVPARSTEAVIHAPDIDAVVICTPTDTHADLIEAAANAGKAILCEKPVDLSADRIRACAANVEKSGVPLMIGFNRRFDPHFLELKRRLTAAEIGTIEILTFTCRDPAPPPIPYIERSGGIFRDMMIHDFDMARFLLEEEPVEVFASGSCLIDPEIGRAGDVDTALAIMRTGSGKLVQISNSRRAAYGFDQRIEVHGSDGMLRVGNVLPTTIETTTRYGSRHDSPAGFFLERYNAAYRDELGAFLDAVEIGRTPSPSIYDGLAAQLLADAATRSARSGRMERVMPGGAEVEGKPVSKQRQV